MTIKKIIKQLLPYGIVRAKQRAYQNRKKETHINGALLGLNGHTYVEIGVRAGKCFSQIAAHRKIGIDPAPTNNFGDNLAPGELFFRMTSDDFFAEHAEQLFSHQRIDVALVDGLHTFSQAIQDVLNLEKYMSPNGVIFIHDCNPPTEKHAKVCDSKECDGESWNGDVWKVAYYLRNHRRDLSFFTLDCDWGVGVLTGFRPSSDHQPPSSEILERCKSLDYEQLDKNRKQLLQLRPPKYSHVFFRSFHEQTKG